MYIIPLFPYIFLTIFWLNMISRNQDRFYGLHAIVASIYSIANQFEVSDMLTESIFHRNLVRHNAAAFIYMTKWIVFKKW